MLSKHPHPTLHPLGTDAIIVRFSLMPDPAANAAAQVFARFSEGAGMVGVNEIVPSLASVLVRFDPAETNRIKVLSALNDLLFASGTDWANVAPPAPLRRWTIPAAFGDEFGPQMDEAATCVNMPTAKALSEFTNARLRVLAIGFAPGQPYLGLLPDAWNIPRQSALTPQVPAGALVVAVRQVVLFANPSATGWRWVGQTAFRPFRPELADAFALRIGDEVQFEAVATSQFRAILAGDNAGAHVGHCEVLS